MRNWWANETKESFREKAQCLIDQYESFTEPLTNLKLSGKATQGENIADNGNVHNYFSSSLIVHHLFLSQVESKLLIKPTIDGQRRILSQSSLVSTFPLSKCFGFHRDRFGVDCIEKNT
jgi:Peptidase family M13